MKFKPGDRVIVLATRWDVPGCVQSGQAGTVAFVHDAGDIKVVLDKVIDSSYPLNEYHYKEDEITHLTKLHKELA